MDNASLIYWLAGVTLLAVLAIGIWQRLRTSQAKRENEHSAMTTPEAGPDPHA